jgi:pyrimidine oxygenase
MMCAQARGRRISIPLLSDEREIWNMRFGVFIPIGNNGWLASTTSPKYLPTFELNRKIVQRAEHYGLDFALAMVKLRGRGGVTQHWDYNLEPFTLMAGIAAVTSRIKIFATVATLAVPPAYAARMAVTIDSISNGRCGLNLVSGWEKAEYEQMGLWPGDEHFSGRYDYLAEYVTIMKGLWESGQSDFKGKYFTMNDCRLLPKPQASITLMCAAASERGMEFSARECDMNFCSLASGDIVQAAWDSKARFDSACERAGRKAATYANIMVIADETDAAAQAKFEHYADGTDYDALATQVERASMDVNAPLHSSASRFRERAGRLNARGRLIGSYETIAQKLDQLHEAGLDGVMMTFDDFILGIEQFGERIQPLMNSRRDVSMIG